MKLVSQGSLSLLLLSTVAFADQPEEQADRIHGEDPETFSPNLVRGLDYYHPDDRDMVSEHVERARKEGGEFHFKLRIINRQGETVNVESFGLARADKTGQVKRVIGVFRALDPHDA